MAKTAAKPKAARKDAKGSKSKAAKAKAEKRAAKLRAEQSKLKKWNREGVTIVDGQKMIGQMPVTKFDRFTKDIVSADKATKSVGKSLKDLMKDFGDAGGDTWAIKQILGLLKKDEVVRDSRIRHFVMYALQLEAPSQPDMFVGLNDGLPSLKSAHALGKAAGMDGGDRNNNPFAALAKGFEDGWDEGQKVLGGKIGKTSTAKPAVKKSPKKTGTKGEAKAITGLALNNGDPTYGKPN